MSSLHFIRVCILLTTLGSLSHVLPAQEKAIEEQDSVSATAELRQSLLGAWAPADGLGVQGTSKIKFWGLKHWYVTEADPNSGQVLFHHGGTYTLDGDQYEETVTFAGPNRMNMIGMKFKFEIEVEKDSYKQVGVDNPYNEQWKRLTN